MARLNLILALVLVAGLAIAEAGTRARRSPQVGQASASATAFGRGGYQIPIGGLGGPRPGFGGNFGRPNVGPIPVPGALLRRPGGQSTSINIAKSISISTGGRGTSQSQASASSRG